MGIRAERRGLWSRRLPGCYVKPLSLALPQGLLATFHLIWFDDDAQEARIGLDVDGFYSNPQHTGDTIFLKA